MHRSRPGILSVVGIVLGGFGCAAVCADELRVLGLLGGTPSAERFVEVAAGSHHALGLDALGAVHAWGWNGRAESSDDLPCGQGEAPPDFGPGRFVTALAAGVRHSMALLDDGSVACWGCEDEACDVPDDLVESPADPAVAIAAGERHSLALLASGSLRCWGESWENHGPCVIPSEAMDAGNPPIRIAAAWGISVALLADGTLVHWGWGDELQGVPDEPVERFALLQTQPALGLIALLEDGRVVLNGEVEIEADPDNPCVDVAGGPCPSMILADGTIRFLEYQGGEAPFPLPGVGGIEPWHASRVVGGQDFVLVLGLPEDCDGDGVPDRDQIEADPALDCNGTGRLDRCERRRELEWAAAFDEDGVSIDLTSEPPLDLPAAFFVSAEGDLSTQDEHLVIEFNGRPIATLFDDADQRDDCVPRGDSFTISPRTWGAGVRTLSVRSSAAVDPDLCGPGGFVVRAVLGTALGPDCDGNGLDDGCEVIVGGVPDLDGDLEPDICAPDCDADAMPDAWAVFQGLVEDCQGNGVPDSCDLQDGTLTDADGDGVPDQCARIPGDLDLDGCVGAGDLGVLLSVWGAEDQPLADLDGDGVVRGGDLGVLLTNWGRCVG